jgi:hypothetical protein
LSLQSDYLKAELETLTREHAELSETFHATSSAALQSQVKRVASHEEAWTDLAESFRSECLAWKTRMSLETASQSRAMELISCALESIRNIEHDTIAALKVTQTLSLSFPSATQENSLLLPCCLSSLILAHGMK